MVFCSRHKPEIMFSNTVSSPHHYSTTEIPDYVTVHVSIQIIDTIYSKSFLQYFDQIRRTLPLGNILRLISRQFRFYLFELNLFAYRIKSLAGTYTSISGRISENFSRRSPNWGRYQSSRTTSATTPIQSLTSSTPNAKSSRTASIVNTALIMVTVRSSKTCAF